MRLYSFFCLFLFVLAFRPVPSYAQLTITETQAIQFGTHVFKDPTKVSRVTINASTGATTADVDTIILIPGQRAEYSLTGGPPNTLYTITVDGDTDMSLGGNPIITLDNFVFKPNTLQTNGAGNDTFRMGARARSLGGGNVYGDGTYNGTYDFTVQF